MSLSGGDGGVLEDAGGVIYVAGNGRSGTTLAGLVFGMVDDHIFVGEGRTVWDKGLRHNFLCSCGDPFHDCRFWSAVVEQTYGSVDAFLASTIYDLYETLIKKTPFRDIYDPARRSAALQRDIDALSAEIWKLHNAIRTVSGRPWIVDSSKHPTYAWLLSGLYGSKLKLVHLIRDPRGVAFSRTRVRTKPDAPDPSAVLERNHPVVAAWRWAERHREIECLASDIGATRLIYEEFVDDPEAALAKIFSDEQVEEALENARAAAEQRPPSHAIAGNPHRFEKAGLVLKLDEEWKTRLSPLNRLLVQLVTSPQMRTYGYRWGV